MNVVELEIPCDKTHIDHFYASIVVKVGIGVSRPEEGQTSIGCRDALKDPVIRSYYRAHYVGTITSRAPKP